MKQILDINKIANIIGLPIVDWEQNCCDISILLLKNDIVSGTLKEGVFIGEIHQDSIFLRNGTVDELRHCWIELDNGQIVDPTRWTITCEKPYIFIGNNNKEYERGITLPLSHYGY